MRIHQAQLDDYNYVHNHTGLSAAGDTCVLARPDESEISPSYLKVNTAAITAKTSGKTDALKLCLTPNSARIK